MKLAVEGYKSIATRKELVFDGLTILSGANSSGKSSFMQPFLVLKQTMENHYDTGALVLNGENVKLTDSTQIISKVTNYGKKSFSISLKTEKQSCAISYIYKKGLGLQVDSVVFEDEEYKTPLILKQNGGVSHIEKSVPQKNFSFIKEMYASKNIDLEWKILREKCFIKAELVPKEKELVQIRAGLEPTKQIQRFISRLIHVPGLRGNPERTYKIAASDDIYPGSFEKYVASIITEWSKLKKHTSKYNQLKQQLVDLGLASSIKTSKVNDTSVEIQVSRNKTDENADCVNIADVGFGVSQTLPVLVALIAAKKGQFVYIEQPELHLHPKAQFKLSSIIVSAVNRGVLVTIETHSSILIRGIQIAAAKKEIDSNKVSLNWFTQDTDTGETKVNLATLDKNGAFGDWPEDFDDTAIEVEQMYLDAVEGSMYE